jgi:hypothetical protein
MTKIRVTNPYFEKEYKVEEGRGDIEYNLVRIQQGLRGFFFSIQQTGKRLL